MIWMNLVCLGSGLSAGLAAGWMLWSSKSSLAVTQKTDRLRQSELAYQMAVEMSQFKGGFLARAAHELRSPLNSIIGVHQLILTDLCETPEEEHEFIAQAHESALKMVQMLNEVIHVAKAQQGTNHLNLQPVSLLEVLHEVDSLTHLLAEDRNLRMTIKLPDPNLYVMADPHWLRQGLVSLVNSAISQMQEGSIKLFVASVDAQFVHIQLEDQRPVETWREAIEFLQSAPADPPKSLQTPQEFSPGFNLVLNQTVIEAMGGRLELLKTPSDSGETLTQIQCSIPLVALELDPSQ